MVATSPAVQGQSQLANKWALLIDSTPDTSPTWVPVFGISTFTPQRSYTTQDNTDFDSDGWASTKQTQRGHSVTGTVQRKKYANLEDAGQKALRKAAESALDIHALYFDRYYGDEAFEGYYSPNWEPQGGGATDLESANFTLNGQGALIPVTNPLWVAPTVTSALPSAAAVGTEVTVVGTGFSGLTGAAAVKVGGTNATSYIVDSTKQLRLIMPAGSAGSAPILIVNPWGTSASFAYTRGA